MREFGSSEFAKTVLRHLWGAPPSLDLEVEASLHACMAELAARGLLHSARDISDGGIAVALAKGGFGNGIGVRANLEKAPDLPLEVGSVWRIREPDDRDRKQEPRRRDGEDRGRNTVDSW